MTAAMIPHAPNATARRRARKNSLKRGETVPCARCGEPISAARASCAISHGLCADCNAPNLRTSREVRERAPMYETQAWERGLKLD